MVEWRVQGGKQPWHLILSMPAKDKVSDLLWAWISRVENKVVASDWARLNLSRSEQAVVLPFSTWERFDLSDSSTCVRGRLSRKTSVLK